MQLKAKFDSIREFFNKYEHRISLGFLMAGFIFDNLTLQRVDFLLDNLILLTYLLIVAASILVINQGIKYASFIAPYAMQFAIGGLFSGYIVFYFRSASLGISWPFLLMLLVFFIGNEFARKHYDQLVFRLAIFFIAIFSYSIFSLPVIFREIGAAIFVLSGLISLLVVTGLVYIIKRFTPKEAAGHHPRIAVTIGAIWLVFNIFYFTNIIPPIPLAMKESGIYHQVDRLPGGYSALEEKKKWYNIFGNKQHLLSGQPLYAYSAVFAPTNLEGRVFHLWSYYDETQSEWIEAGRIGFPILGGRDSGYRGYSIKENVFPGYWRVDVVTERDQIIGRMKFRVIETTARPELEMKTLE